MAWFGVYAAAIVFAGLGNVFYALSRPDTFLREWSPLPIAASLILFCLVHGIRRYGLRGAIAYFVIVVSVTWMVETIGVLTGYPFGGYNYDAWMKPFVGAVPLKVLFAYFSVSYPAWIAANAIAGRFDNGFDAREINRIPAIAAGLMVAWDFSMDPLRATVEGFWTWEKPGLYLGIPLSNFVGWYVTSWLMFRAFGQWLLWNRTRLPTRKEFAHPMFWAVAAGIYLTFLGEYLLNPFIADPDVPGAAGWTVGEVHRGAAVAALVTMLPAAVLAVRRAYGLPASQRQSAPARFNQVAAK